MQGAEITLLTHGIGLAPWGIRLRRFPIFPNNEACRQDFHWLRRDGRGYGTEMYCSPKCKSAKTTLDVVRHAFHAPPAFSSNPIPSFSIILEMAQLISLQALARRSENPSPAEALLHAALLDPPCNSVAGLRRIGLSGPDDAVVAGCAFHAQ